MSIRRSLVCVAASLALIASVPTLAPADAPVARQDNAQQGVSGTYTWTMGGGGGGGGGNESTLVLKQEGATLTGTLTGGRGGETPIEAGTVDGNKITFKITRDWNGNQMVTEYAGTVEGETLKLKVTTVREIEAKKKA